MVRRIMRFEPSDMWASIERCLIEMKLPRTRENFIRMSYEDLPEEWDDEAEELNLPPDLRLVPAPSHPLPH